MTVFIVIGIAVIVVVVMRILAGTVIGLMDTSYWWVMG